ncbi:hypothetical protein [Neotabrizicola shimadae]|uniref:Apea-like HEPN domain-containing protein n=1 Tax=Neotabrizicola shimadae TaxID=2807096 RepID=A0A8G0ZN04_9RHOB|nr:hypothetical protein [Neotabrizicola shimadae]QYZ68341.1 hypothetical protein JO391_11120 [Neotabrizicola shimadae]
MSAELMQIFLPSVNLEISVDAADHPEAKKLLEIFQTMLYVSDAQPTVAPFATSHSLNEYAGINYRSSSLLRDKLPEGLRTGITAKDSRVEGWPNELCLSILQGETGRYSSSIDVETFVKAAGTAAVWQEIEARHLKAATLRSAVAKAPLMPDRASSVLHIWQALESVFGKGPELSFRMSLSLAELCGPVAARQETYARAKKSYQDRSGITHGKIDAADVTQWMRAWDLLKDTVRAILCRRTIPSEDELFSELLSR